MIKKIKLIDFLEFINFRDWRSDDDYNTKIIRIYYPEKNAVENPSFNAEYDKDRYFEYGVYDFAGDKQKRLKDTLNNYILNCFVYSVGIREDDDILSIQVVTESEIDATNEAERPFSRD